MKKFSKFKNFFAFYIFLLILIVAAIFRFYGLSWDQKQHLHPDERFLTMVTQAVRWPSPISQYLNPNSSPLNPYKVGYDFFVYGTLPIKTVKLASQIISFDKFAYNNITLVGRLVSALFDLGVVFLVYKIGKKVFNTKTGLLASFLYSISVLPIQLSHFFAVDTFLVFFLTFSFYTLISATSCCHSGAKRSGARESKSNKILRFIQNDKKFLVFSGLLGISFGLALACKISALIFMPIIGLGFIFCFFKVNNIKISLLATCYLLLATYFAFRLSDPRIFSTNNFFNPTPNPQFVANIKQLQSFNDPENLFPPGIQWIKTKAVIFPLKNMILWGLGLPLGLLTVTTLFYSAFKLLKKINHTTIQQFNHFLIFSWILLLFIYQSIQFTKAMRYFYPIYPSLAILTANLLLSCSRSLKQKVKTGTILILYSLFFILILVWPISFISIYSRPHSRVTASEWIYKNIPAGSTISCEHWDDCLPLPLEDKSYQLYKTEILTLFDPDSLEKWQKINSQLEKLDYLIMSSNRLWGSIPQVPEKYPITSEFYEDLFKGKKLSSGEQFTKVAEITSYPKIPILNIEIPDESAEEFFTVYDHPKILIYKKI